MDKMSKFRRMYKEISKVNDILIICITSKRIKRRLHLLKQIWEDKQQELKTYKIEKTCPASETNKEKYHIELVLVHVLPVASQEQIYICKCSSVLCQSVNPFVMKTQQN